MKKFMDEDFLLTVRQKTTMQEHADQMRSNGVKMRNISQVMIEIYHR